LIFYNHVLRDLYNFLALRPLAPWYFGTVIMQQPLPRRELDFLKDWSAQARRKPLLIRGARQTGKTTLVREFARLASLALVEINFERNPEFVKAFNVRDPGEILTTLELMTDRTIDPVSGLLFLDEIQAAPEALVALRYFCEERPELPVIAAGSLLEFTLANEHFSMPVGRLEYLHLGPMQFEDFLRATGHTNLASHLCDLTLEEPGIPEPVHNRYLALLNQYWIVGGLPEAVARYAQSGNFSEASRVHQGILATYREDFNKYSHGAMKERIQLVFDQLPGLVGHKLKYSRISREHRSIELAEALQQLCMARIASKVHHSAANGIPLSAEINRRRFKMLYLDIGLLCTGLNLNVLDLNDRDLTLVNKGAVAEQFIGQQLLHAGQYYEAPVLHCWMREVKSAAAEVDYLLTSGQQVIPVEVKSGSAGTLKSLHQFIKEKQTPLALRFSTALPPGLMQHQTRLTDNTVIHYNLLSLPLYLVGQAGRLLKACLAQLSGADRQQSE